MRLSVPCLRFVSLLCWLSLIPCSQSFAQQVESPQVTQLTLLSSLIEGDRLELMVDAAGSPAPTLQWYRNGDPLPGSTTQMYVVEGVGPEDAGRYVVRAINSQGEAVSEVARVIVRPDYSDKTVARQWNEEVLAAMRLDYPIPTVHARALFHLSAAMWDAWCAYDDSGLAVPYLVSESPPVPPAVESARNEAISHAAYGVIRNRYRLTPGAAVILPSLDRRMRSLGFDPENRTMLGDSPAAVGNRIAARIIAIGMSDGSNERSQFIDNTGYQPVNTPLIFQEPGVALNLNLINPNRWQPISFSEFRTKAGENIEGFLQEFFTPHWERVRPFAMERATPHDIYYDPGPPPYLGGEGDQEFREAVVELIRFSSWLDPEDDTMIDISPGAFHNNSLGASDGTGYEVNPFSGEPYVANVVRRADYIRILAEVWDNGPDAEKPPGMWNAIGNRVSNHPAFERRFAGEGPVLDALEWDVKLYFALNAAIHDAAIACWDTKVKYDYVRPITIIRYMGQRGQSSDPALPTYHEDGLPLVEGLIELITEESAAEGERHEHLYDYVGQIAVRSWLGQPEDPLSQYAGVGWIRAVEWMPYQLRTFVTPSFAAYTSGHSTMTRAAAEAMTLITGDAFFPGGYAELGMKRNGFLEFEMGPTADFKLTWARYYDCSDEAGNSRRYGGIHVRADDYAGRRMGAEAAIVAFEKAKGYFDGTATTLDTLQTYTHWSGELLAIGDNAAHPERAEGTFHYESSPFSNYQRFLLGLDPGDPGYDRLRFLEIDSYSGDKHLRVDFELFLETDVAWALQVSDDMLTWTTVEMETALEALDILHEGRARVRLRDTESTEGRSARFLRIAISEQ